MDSLKEVMAVIRIDKMNQTKRALRDAGISSMTAMGSAYGRGKGLWDAKVLEGARNNTPEALELLGKEPRLRPQRIVCVVVPAKKVQLVVDTIIKANQTPSPGDGKIFVMPVADTIRVRTGETGVAILD
jgi:nitrogen regulatory protein PII 2